MSEQVEHDRTRRAPAAFRLNGPLPSGVTVLEASAGTGKTFTIAALAARFVAEGAPLSSLLLVTFTRIATGELRERVRERMVDTERELRRIAAGDRADRLDEVTTTLADGDPEAVKRRRDRLADAISNFDDATIATTHSFCQEVLGELGTLGDPDPEAALTEDLDELTEQVIDDLYVRAFLRDPDPPFDRREAGRIARFSIAHPTATIHPVAPAPGSVPERRARLAARARDELEARKRRLAVMDYDDLLVRLRDVLVGPHAAAAVRRLRARYRVVLIDEFQDTDPVQWEIVSRAFAHPEVVLVLVADPKQAIYAFRGADVHAYLAAAAGAQQRSTLATNRRADQRLIDALDALFGHGSLGHPEIAYRPVRATDAHSQPRLHGAPCDASMRIRVVDRSQMAAPLTPRGFASAPPTRELIAKDLAADVVALLSSDATVAQSPDHPQAVLPRDIAVLVRSHWNARLVQRELGVAGVPAVLGGAGSVLATPAAADWLTLLSALARPASPPRARAAALTPLIGWSAERVACSTEQELEELHQRLHGWARMLRSLGVATLWRSIMQQEGLPARLLREQGGERRMTDLEHVSEVLHGVATAERLGTAALTAWLRERIAAADRDADRDELTRRLESDADAVQVLTIHRSKGLEFPIVYCPFLWEPPRQLPPAEPVFFHDPASGTRAIDVGLEGPGYAGHRLLAEDDARGEDLRLTYVALTRARHQTVLWWAGSAGSRSSAMSRIAFERGAGGEIRSICRSVPTDAQAFECFGAIAARAPGAISVEWARLGSPVHWSPPLGRPAELCAADLHRATDRRWRRTSYTDITTAAHEAWVSSEPEEPVQLDEPPEPPSAPLPDGEPEPSSPELDTLDVLTLPLASLPAGPRIGTLVHRVLEAVEFDSPALEDDLRTRLGSLAALSGLDVGDPELLVGGLADAIGTPLAAEPGSLRLRDLSRADRLDELQFELPLAGGDQVTGRVTLRGIAALLREHLVAHDSLAAYAERLGDPLLRGELRGYLTGSIDLVARVPGDGRPRFEIVDYKTNWLAGVEQQLLARHYAPAALLGEMLRAHYVLQALLYCTALHRYLRWRVGGYDPNRDLGGIHYLFLRGMLGERSPVIGGARLGVFSWCPPGSLVTALSDLLDGDREVPS
jgi:exodeoxyribonuclease V beta subunit